MTRARVLLFGPVLLLGACFTYPAQWSTEQPRLSFIYATMRQSGGASIRLVVKNVYGGAKVEIPCGPGRFPTATVVQPGVYQIVGWRLVSNQITFPSGSNVVLSPFTVKARSAAYLGDFRWESRRKWISNTQSLHQAAFKSFEWNFERATRRFVFENPPLNGFNFIDIKSPSTPGGGR